MPVFFFSGLAGGSINDKNLKSEIETYSAAPDRQGSKVPINDKNLKSEIETRARA